MGKDSEAWWRQIMDADGVGDDVGTQAEFQGYIESKAQRFVELGSDAYREADALGMPPAAFDDGEVAVLLHACRQVVDGRGFCEERPIKGLDVSSCQAFVAAMHFRVVQQTAKPVEGQILDALGCQHLVTPMQRGQLYFLVDSGESGSIG